MTAGGIARKLWWINQEFFPVISFIRGSPCSYIAWRMNNRPVGGRSSETCPHPMDVTNTIIIVIAVH
jgi:hypothetical protein